ncbi:MAG: universal stress protein [Burkholderiales bacterium]|nr:universal stress protein [Burkholderiales bacterium]
MKSPLRLIVATDLSAPARHAVDRAYLLAADAKGELHIIHALELDALDNLRELLGANLTSAKSAIDADARDRMQQLVAHHAQPLGIAAQIRVVAGKPLQVISCEADALNTDLLVLGARGESYLRHAILGSTAARVIRKAARCPILIVKQSPHDAYRSVLVAVDFSPASLLAIHAAKRWAPVATLVLVHAFELPYEGLLWRAGIEQDAIAQYINADLNKHRAQLHDLAAEAGLTPADYSVRVLHGEPSQQIIAMEQEYDADLIVIGKHGANFTEELLLGSVTKHVLAESQGDVLVVAYAHSAAN